VRVDRAGLRLESALEVDPSRLEPAAFSFAVDVLGERREVKGTLEADDHFHVRGAGLGRPFERRVPHGGGTLVDLFADPVTKLFALPLLLPALARGTPVPVRTVQFVAPALEPVVLLGTYTLRGERDGLRLVELEAGGARVALWLRADGLPVKVRAFGVGEGPPLEYRLAPGVE
jgi:hypothetical protein